MLTEYCISCSANAVINANMTEVKTHEQILLCAFWYHDAIALENKIIFDGSSSVKGIYCCRSRGTFPLDGHPFTK